MGKLNVNGANPHRLRFAGSPVPKAFLGEELVWDSATMGQGLEGPKIDPSHPLANRPYMLRLVDGQLMGMTGNASVTIADNAFASNTAGTLAFASEGPLVGETPPRTLRVSALIKVDKTAGRYSRIGFASNTNGNDPTTASPDIYVGHDAGSGIRIGSVNFALSIGHTIIEEAKLVDGAWYRVNVSWDNVLDQNTTNTNTGKARVQGTAEPVDPANTPAVPWYPPGTNGRHNSVSYVPSGIVARTNSPLGTIRDLFYTDTMLAAADDNAPIQMLSKMGDGSSFNDASYLYSKGKSAPLRIIMTAGGSGVYGGLDWAHGNGRPGHPYDAWRSLWRELADLGYTVLHTTALHEGWGADDHLTKQIEALNKVKAEWSTDSRLYYLGYSMGGLSAWRAIMGRAGYPSIRAAYFVAGAAHLDMYYDTPMYSAIKTRWPDRQALDEPINFPAADLIARGTRVRMVTSTADTNVVKSVSHDPMFAKYAGSGLATELVHQGIGHFDPLYWDAADIVAFYEGMDI